MRRQAQPRNCADAAGLALCEPTVEGRLMVETRISRRAALMGAGAVAAWLASPARALLQAVGRLEVPAFVDPLISRMTLEEKAGQLSLMASAWGGGAAVALNPPAGSTDFAKQLQ